MNNLDNTNFSLINKKERNITSNRRLSFITSIIEFKNYGNDSNYLEILENSDIYSILDFPEFLNNKNGHGFIFKSIKGDIDLKIKCRGNGNLKIDFKSLNLKNRYGKDFDIHLNYNNITINNTRVINKNTQVSSKNPFTYQIKVKDNEIIQIHAEWEPIDVETILDLNYDNKKPTLYLLSTSS